MELLEKLKCDVIPSFVVAVCAEYTINTVQSTTHFAPTLTSGVREVQFDNNLLRLYLSSVILETCFLLVLIVNCLLLRVTHCKPGLVNVHEPLPFFPNWNLSLKVRRIQLV